VEQADASGWMAFFARHTALIAQELGHADKAREYRQDYEMIKAAINEQLWHGEDGFYYDRNYEGHLREKSYVGLISFIAGAAEGKRAERVPLFVRNHDLACDYHPVVMLYELLSQRLTPAEFLTWLQDYWAVMPPEALRVAFTETHDTRRFHPPAYAWRGSAAERAMFGILVASGFIPMVWAGQERGLEDFHRAILRARAASRAIREGVFIYDAVITESAFRSEARAGDGHLWVFNLVRRADDEIVWALVSLWPEKTTFAFHLDADVLGLNPSATYRLHDLVADEDFDEYGRATWRGSELRDFTLTPEPYRPYLLRLDSAGTSSI